MKRLKTELKELQKEMKELKNHPEKAMAVQKKAMDTNMKYETIPPLHQYKLNTNMNDFIHNFHELTNYIFTDKIYDDDDNEINEEVE